MLKRKENYNGVGGRMNLQTVVLMVTNWERFYSNTPSSDRIRRESWDKDIVVRVPSALSSMILTNKKTSESSEYVPLVSDLIANDWTIDSPAHNIPIGDNVPHINSGAIPALVTYTLPMEWAGTLICEIKLSMRVRDEGIQLPANYYTLEMLRGLYKTLREQFSDQVIKVAQPEWYQLILSRRGQK